MPMHNNHKLNNQIKVPTTHSYFHVNQHFQVSHTILMNSHELKICYFNLTLNSQKFYVFTKIAHELPRILVSVFGQYMLHICDTPWVSDLQNV